MPESNKGTRARQLKANRAAGIGDEKGRLPSRTKAEAIMISCTICKAALKVTKTNTEIKQHALGKHGKENIEECFPGAEAHANAIIQKTTGSNSGGGSGNKGGGGMTKAERKKKEAAGMDDLLSAGLSSGTGKKKGGKKR